MQTPTANSLAWAEKEPFLDINEAFIPSLSERLSFVGFQPVSGNFPFPIYVIHDELNSFASVPFSGWLAKFP